MGNEEDGRLESNDNNKRGSKSEYGIPVEIGRWNHKKGKQRGIVYKAFGWQQGVDEQSSRVQVEVAGMGRQEERVGMNQKEEGE